MGHSHPQCSRGRASGVVDPDSPRWFNKGSRLPVSRYARHCHPGLQNCISLLWRDWRKVERDGGQQNSTQPGWMWAWMRDTPRQGILTIQSEDKKDSYGVKIKTNSRGSNVMRQWPSNNHSDSPAARQVLDAPPQPPADGTPATHHEAYQTRKPGWEYACAERGCTPVPRSSTYSCHRRGRHRHACFSHCWRSCRYQVCSRLLAQRGAGRRWSGRGRLDD